MVSTFLEVEAKFAVDQDAAVPSFEELGAVETTHHHSLSAIYYDTRDLRLTRSKVTLRRRTGGGDEGWHLKLPSAQGRLELGAPLGEEPRDGQIEVPEELLAQIRSIVRSHELIPIAQVDNERTEITIANEDSSPIAEFCDDHVTASSLLLGGSSRSWREWEIELAGDLPGTEEGTELIAQASELLRAAGARTSDSPSKLVAALGASLHTAPVPAYLAQQVDPDSAAGAVVRALKANRDKMVEYDPKVRRDEWDSVHQMRVATRELRSHLQTFDGVLAGEPVRIILDELKMLAGLLGKARDAEVVEERFAWLIDSDDSGLISEDERAQILGAMNTEYQRAHRHVVAALNSPRYLNLLEQIDALLANPPVITREESAHSTATSPDDMEHVMAASLDKAFASLRKRHKKAVRNWENKDLSLHEREDYFHDMRKAAKKLRYSAEAVHEATGLKTRKVFKACKQMQSTLGDFQDAVTSRDRIAHLAQQHRRHGRDTFALGMLYQRERELGLKALKSYEEDYARIAAAYKQLGRKK
ncbi:CYTH and CHAD domain-containing protein [Corynebacterium tapiri]|uniref:CYTH and CHAD domain-containing protein n=1 Tax=Corynebacterium tapiri TaxID=1448266 RepID=A0A5C4U5W4_9CORY|nr:CYTH and CHAD domain-containing protein [Corynebacterium tapiri]TNL98733.1 CYTH and CHAD domain-containing protein [Corynebacterium tapiri]